MSDALLEIRNLRVSFGRRGTAPATALEDVSLSLNAGEKLALVGESGSGKSVTALSVLQLNEPSLTHYESGEIRFLGNDLLHLSEREINRVRGREIAMIFQEPMTSLNPLHTIGQQLAEPIMLHFGLQRGAARQRAVELLERTGIAQAAKRLDAYPHMLSGGQRQRVMIAMALSCQPKLLIADEPTTALDVTVQLQILELLDALQAEFGMAVLLITHDLNIVRRFADRVCVMQRGRVVEEGEARQIFSAPGHAYTKHLLASEPPPLARCDDEHDMSARAKIVEANGISRVYAVKAGLFRRNKGELRAVDEASIEIREGETLGIVGESGSGKSTLGMCLMRLQPCAGAVRFQGHELNGLSRRALQPMRKNFQVVFQDPYSSLSPRMTVEQIVSEGLQIHFPEMRPRERRERVTKILQEVGLEAAMLYRYPHEFSGGQRQRIAIARAMVLSPKLVLLDEPTSALDVSVQKQVLELLRALQLKYGIAYLFISHDLKVIRAMAHRIAVMRAGRIIETGETEKVYANPNNEYTRALFQASFLQEA